VAFASVTLNKTQQSYSQLDREGLAIMFGVKRFRQFLIGREFTLVTDNSALRYIFDPDKGIPVLTAHRLQHWAAVLSGSKYVVDHRKSALLAHVDALSRLPEQEVMDFEVNFVNSVNSDLNYVDQAPPSMSFPLTAVEIALRTKEDATLEQVLSLVSGGIRKLNAKDPCLKPYVLHANVLSIDQVCLMFGTRVISYHSGKFASQGA